MDQHSGPVDALGELGVVQGQPREDDEQVQSRGHALDPGLRQLRPQRAEQGVAPGALPLADGTDVPLELAGGDQAGQHQLRQRGTAQVGGVLGRHQVRVQPGRRDQPAQPHARGQRLGRGAGVGDVTGCGGLQRGHRGSVVAVLGVVVVLDDHRVGRDGPVQQLAAALRGQHHPGRELMRGRQQRGPQAAVRQVAGLQSVLVDRDRRGGQAPVDELVTRSERAGVLDGDPGVAVGVQPLGQQGQGLGHPADDDDVVGRGPQAPGPGQPPRELPAQRRAAARVAVAELGHARPVQDRPLGAQPGGAREAGQVGDAGGEVEFGPRPPRLRQQRRRRPRRPTWDLRAGPRSVAARRPWCPSPAAR